MGVRLVAAGMAAQLVLLAFSCDASAAPGCAGETQVPTATTMPQAASALACDMNALRSDHGLAPLRPDARLQAAAQDMAADMAAQHFLGHVASDGRTLFARMIDSRYIDSTVHSLLLENVDWGTGAYGTPLATTAAWMQSDLHRANMLDPSVDDVGIGVALGPVEDGGVNGVFYVADFGARSADQTASRSSSSSSLRRGSCGTRKRARHRVHHRVRRHVRRVHHRRCGA